MPYISNEGLKKLDSYQYKSGGYSKLDNIINPFWEWVEKTFIPRTMAPNTVTLIGFVLMALSYFCMLFFDDTFTKDLPRWTYIFAAVCQFLYQTLDAVDGKHARTTKASSPLGQLFDHGCDSFSVTFLILTVCQMCKLGPTFELLFFAGVLQLAFFCANWGEYHSGVLTTSVTYFGVTEGELVIIGTLLITGIFGPEAWNLCIADIFGLTISPDNFAYGFLKTAIKMLILRGMYFAVIIIVIYFAVTVFRNAKDKMLAITQFLPVLCLLGAVNFWSHVPIFVEDPALILLSAALIFSLLTCKLIISSLTEMRTPWLSWEVIVFFLFGVIIKYVIPIFGSKHLEEIVLYLMPIYVIASVFRWAGAVIEEISSHLGIYCFSLEKRARRKLEEETDTEYGIALIKPHTHVDTN